MNRSISLLLAGLVIQAGVLSVTWHRAYYPTDLGPNSDWKKIYLKLVPVDPRSLFQGNYVQLRYDIHSIPREKVMASETELAFGHPLYAALEQQGEVWTVTKVTAQLPTSGVFIKGRSQFRQSSGIVSLIYGIEQFYAPKEDAEKLESRTRRSWNGPSAKMLAEVVVNSEGRAGLVDIVPANE